MNRIQILLAIAVFMFLGCAATDKPESSSATIDYYFTHDTAFDTGTVVFTTGSGTWTIEKAQIVLGEIGVHWEEPFAPRGLRHDVPGGKISPKIPGYFAIDWLNKQYIQALKVEPGIFSHIHMAVQNDLSVRENNLGIGGTVKDIENEKFNNLKGRTLYFSGKVNTYPFELYTTQTFEENDMGQVIFTHQVFENEHYTFYLSPKLKTWFSAIDAANLTVNNGTILINQSSNLSQLEEFVRVFAAKNSMLLEIKRN
jgi:hypothetical protein